MNKTLQVLQEFQDDSLSYKYEGLIYELFARDSGFEWEHLQYTPEERGFILKGVTTAGEKIAVGCRRESDLITRSDILPQIHLADEAGIDELYIVSVSEFSNRAKKTPTELHTNVKIHLVDKVELAEWIESETNEELLRVYFHSNFDLLDIEDEKNLSIRCSMIGVDNTDERLHRLIRDSDNPSKVFACLEWLGGEELNVYGEDELREWVEENSTILGLVSDMNAKHKRPFLNMPQV